MDNESFTANTTTGNAPAQSTDWAAVREFYMNCRSYKTTADKYGLNPDTVKKRSQRENWKSGGQIVNREGTKTAIVSPQEGTNPVPLSPAEGTKTAIMSPQEGTNPVPLSPLVPSDTSSLVCFPELPALPNLTSQTVSFCHPWNQPIVSHDRLKDKAAYRTYITAPGTKDCLFSGIRGLNFNLRVGRDNRPVSLLAIVADYDMPLTDEQRQKKTAKLATKPNFISTSYSGGTHALWILEAPIPLMPNDKMVHELLSIVAKKLKLQNAYGQLDTKAFFNPSQYYHAGWNWQLISEEPIPEATSLLWFDEAMEKSRFAAGAGIIVPLERVWEEMKKRGWDKRWDGNGGEFEVGARGCRFWDPTADCPTAAIVTETGMVCFTGPFPFQSWEQIFGSAFIESFRADSFGQALTECYFVNNSFYVCREVPGEEGSTSQCWIPYNRQNFELLASARYGLSNKAPEKGEDSPVKQLMSKIISHNSLPASCPFIYRKERIIHIQGEPRLNTSLLRVHEPDLGKGKSWGDGFPWIAAFMERLFPDRIQRERFLAAWAYAYRNAYQGHPRNGHTIFIAGGVGAGKNFLTDCLYGPSMGGATDASEYILGKTRFNDHLMGMGVWTLNDTVSKGDYRERATFAKALKRMAANYLHSCEGKFKSATGIFWSGRIIVTLNTDPDSLSLLPDIELSNKDKISMFKTTEEPMQDKDAKKNAQAEMGALCSFLLNWKLPEHCVGDERWGVKNYLHDELYAEAANSGSTASFKEILTEFAKAAFEADKALDVLEGSATWFMQQMLLVDGLKDMLRGEVTARSIGKRMASLASTGHFPMTFSRKTRQRVWCIERKAFMDYIGSSDEQDVIDETCPF